MPRSARVSGVRAAIVRNSDRGRCAVGHALSEALSFVASCLLELKVKTARVPPTLWESGVPRARFFFSSVFIFFFFKYNTALHRRICCTLSCCRVSAGFSSRFVWFDYNVIGWRDKVVFSYSTVERPAKRLKMKLYYKVPYSCTLYKVANISPLKQSMLSNFTDV